MTESSKGMPELSSGAWFAFLVAALLGLALAVYPLVGYPAIMRRYVGAPAALGWFFRPSVVYAFAAVTFGLLVASFTGRRVATVRSRLAYLALGAAVLGIALLIAALKSVVLRAA